MLCATENPRTNNLITTSKRNRNTKFRAKKRNTQKPNMYNRFERSRILCAVIFIKTNFVFLMYIFASDALSDLNSHFSIWESCVDQLLVI